MALTQVKTLGIEDDAVTTDKLANAINTARDANTAKVSLTDNSVTLAKMAGGTDGQIITYDANGDPVAVGPGTDGQVLTSTGAGSPPAFEDATGGIASLVADTSPQLGGNLDVNGNDITGDAIDFHAADGQVIAKLHKTNSSEFYFNNSKKFEVTNGGISVTGSVTPSSGIYLGGSGGSNHLTDYEEGTWTPDVRFNDTSASGQTCNGRYTKVGNIVHANFQFTLTNKGSGDGQFHLNGFPFAPSSGWSDIASGMGYMHRFADTNNDSGQVYQQFYSSIMYLAFRGLNNNTVRLTDDNFRDDCAISGMIIYRTDA